MMDLDLIRRTSSPSWKTTRGSRRVTPDHKSSPDPYGVKSMSKDSFKASSTTIVDISRIDIKCNKESLKEKSNFVFTRERRKDGKRMQKVRSDWEKKQEDEESMRKYEKKYGRLFCLLQAETRKRQILPSDEG